jgi:hypothetical protein
MRAELVRHFDLIAVVWGLSIVVCLMVVTLSRAPLTNDQWTHQAQSGPVWMVNGDVAPGN